MARPRLHSVDDLLDVAERLATEEGSAGLTLRGLAASTGASNGSIYHAFRSKEELRARLWLRATARLGEVMEEAARPAGAGEDAAERAVVAVALAPVVLAQRHPASARLFFSASGNHLMSDDVPPDVVAELQEEYERFATLLSSLAEAVWNRSDGIALSAITACVVDIPAGLLRRRLLQGRGIGAATERRIEAAVRGVLALPLDPPRETTRTSDEST